MKSRRKQKRIIKSRARQLIPNVTYALGCRGHPGLVVERSFDPRWCVGDLYSADVGIKSLIDGNVESCSIYHCAPEPLFPEYAKEWGAFGREHHQFDTMIRYGGFRPEEIIEWRNSCLEEGRTFYVLSDMDGETLRDGVFYTEERARGEFARLDDPWFVDRGITNVRIVDGMCYPRPPELI